MDACHCHCKFCFSFGSSNSLTLGIGITERITIRYADSLHLMSGGTTIVDEKNTAFGIFLIIER